MMIETERKKKGGKRTKRKWGKSVCVFSSSSSRSRVKGDLVHGHINKEHVYEKVREKEGGERSETSICNV